MSGCPFNPNFSEPEDPNPLHGGGSAAAKLRAETPTSDPQDTPSILGFESATKSFFKVSGRGTADQVSRQPTHYSSYLGVETLLRLQDGVAGSKPEGHGLMHHEELTFIVVHQVFELWFKLVTADLNKARDFLRSLGNDEPATRHDRLTHCVQYLRRAQLIFHHVQGAFGVMESMHPGDFIEFRDFLVPASGFQSVGFRSLEQLLGIPNVGRLEVNGANVFSYLKPEEQTQLSLEAKLPSINELLINTCANLSVPDGFIDAYLGTHRRLLEAQQFEIAGAKRDDPKALRLIQRGVDDMKAMLDDPSKWAEGAAFPNDDAEQLFNRAVIGGLLAISYRSTPRFSLFAQLLEELIGVEEGLLLWRSRHSHMAERMIGRRLGTGGSSGVGYLELTRRYRVFHSLWLIRKMIIRASALPPLSHFAGYEDTPFFVGRKG